MRLEPKSGFYTIIHKPTGKVYFGSSRNVRGRVYQHAHRIRNGNHENPKLRVLSREWSEFSVVVTYASLEQSKAWALKYNSHFRGSEQCCSAIS